MNSTIEEYEDDEKESEINENEFVKIGDSLLEELFKVKIQKREIIEAASGSKPEIYHEFIKNVCSKVIKV